MKKNIIIVILLIGLLILEASWFFFNFDSKEQNTHYDITKETPKPLQLDKNIFVEPNDFFSFVLPPKWTYTSTSSVHSTSTVDVWNFISDNVQIASLQYPTTDISFNSCSDRKYLYLHSYKTNDPHTTVIGEICAACEETPENLGFCKISKLPNTGYIYWQKGVEGKIKNDFTTTTGQMALMKFNFSFDGMDMNKAVDILDQIAGSVVLSERGNIVLPGSVSSSVSL